MKNKLLTLLFALCAAVPLLAYDNYLKGTWGVGGDWTTNDGVKFVNGKLTLRLAANTTYQFKLFDTNGNKHYTDMNASNESTPTMTRSSCTRWAINKWYDAAGGNTAIKTDVAGDYVFTLVWDDGGPHLSVTYPDSYIALDYIEFKGNDRARTIHTGYIPNANTIVETKFNAYNSGNNWRAIFSGRNTHAGSGISLYVNGSNNDHLGYFVSDMTGDGDNFADLTLNADHTVTASLASLTVDGNTKNTNKTEWKNTNRDITLFSNPEWDQSFEGRIYYFVIKEGETVKHNFVPKMRVSDKAIGFFDTVTNEFVMPTNSNGFNGIQQSRDWGQNSPWLAKYVFKNYEGKNNDGQDNNAVTELDKLTDPDNDSNGNNWTSLAFDDSSWKTMIMPCHNNINTNEKGTKWEGYYNCYWFRRHFNLTEEEINSKTITVLNVHDDDYELYVNGHLIVKKGGWEDNINNPVRLEIPAGYLHAGDNVIAAEVQQNWGGAWFDCAITTADCAVTEIANADQLRAFAEAVNGGETTKKGKLTADIDLAGVTVTMIGTDANKFKGAFVGQGHKIMNMSLSGNENHIGFFRQTEGATIMDVEFYNANVNVTSGQNTGVIVGTCIGTTINRCAVVNSYLKGNDHTGSIVGCAKGDSKITNCYSNAKVISNHQAGGMVGTSEGLHIEHCIFMGQSIDALNSGARGLISLLEGDGTTIMKNNLVATQHVFSASGTTYCKSLVTQNGKTLIVDQNYSWNSTRYGKDDANQTFSLNSNDANGYQIAPGDVNKNFFNNRGFNFESDWKMVEGQTYAGGSYPVLKWMSAPATEVTVSNDQELIDFSIFRWDNTNVKLSANVNCNEPISNDYVRFKGTFDGQGHTVALNIDNTETGVGLIGVATGGAIVKNVITTGSVKGDHFVGGIIGVTKGSGSVTIERCGNEADITATNQNAAGIVGCNESGNVTITISNCYNTGKISGGRECAAISGWLNNNADVTNCYNAGEVTGIDSDGRTFARWNSGTYTNCYNTLNAKTPIAGRTDSYPAEKVASGELCYALNGNKSTDVVWYQKLGSNGDSHPIPFAKDGATVYYTGIHYTNAGQKYTQMSVEDNYYLISSPEQLEYFSEIVSMAGGKDMNAKLTADLDYNGKTHTPIGNSEGHKFQGIFDGQGHRISNLTMNESSKENIGFFGWIRGGGKTVIKNMVIDSTCSFTGSNKVGAFVGTYQVGGGSITLENLVNEANVTGRQDVAAFIGSEHGGDVTFTFCNLVNKGTIKATDGNPYAGALCCYLRVKSGSSIENVVNLGTIIGHNGGNIGRHNISNVVNLIDLSTTDNKTQGKDSGLNADDVVSGKLAYYLNSKDNQNNDTFFQTFGTDAYPVPFATSKQVILNGTYQNPGADVALNESNSFGTTQNFDANVTINRKMKADIWNTFCVPVDMDIPSDWDVKELAGVTVTGDVYHMSFDDASSIEAGKAYMVRPSTAVTEFIVENATVKGDIHPTEYEGLTYTGVYNNGKAPQGSFIISNNLFYIVNSDVTLKAFRGYITVPAEEGAQAKSIVYDMEEGTTTGMSHLTPALSQGEGVYNLAGQRVNGVQKGVNIVNGKKYVVK